MPAVDNHIDLFSPQPQQVGDPPVGGRLSFWAHEWRTVCQDSQAFRTVSEGIKLHFKDQPPPLTRVPIEFSTSTSQRDRLRTVVQELLIKAAIEVVDNPSSPGFYSRLFTVPKASGGCRPVIDLSALNRYIECPHFQMETADSIRHSIRPGEWVTSIDISDAYFHIPVAPAARKYFRFVVDGVPYQFRALPFGLNTAPREFTKLLQSVLSQFRDRAIKVHAYLDDWAVRASSQAECERHTNQVLYTLRRLGWRINEQKSELRPKQQFIFLGMEFNTVSGRVAPAPKHQARIRGIFKALLRKPVWSARQLHSLVGYLQFLASLTKRGRLHLRPIQRWLRARWVQARGSWSDLIQVDSDLIELLRWWTLPERFVGIPLVPPEPTMSLCTDASTVGWGAHLDRHEASGTWGSDESQTHINNLELKAILLALQQFAPLLQDQSIRLYCDNATAVAYLKKEGGTHSDSLSEIAEDILYLSDSLGLNLLPIHLPGARNVRADALSRRGTALPGEWSMQPQALAQVFQRWGQPVLDLFATAQNKMTPVFVSPFPDQTAWKVDALSFPWRNLGLVYAFPPAPILPLVLRHIHNSEDTLVILIAPHIPLRPWYPDLLTLTRDGPIPLPLHQWPLRQRVPGVKGWVLHLQPETLQLAAWLLSATN